MKTIKEVLSEADPVRYEPEISALRREATRRVVATAANTSAQLNNGKSYRFMRVATITLAVLGVLLLALRIWSPGGFATHAAVRFEIRLAEDMAAPGLQEAKIMGTERTIYLHQEIVAGNADVAGAELLQSAQEPNRFGVGLRFTPEGARKVRAATENHIGKRVAILIDDVVVLAPVVRAAIGDSAEINGNYTRDEALRIVNGI
jgi:hypothetical protein